MTTSNRTFDIAVLPGDGIGREVMAACLELLIGGRDGDGRPGAAAHDAQCRAPSTIWRAARRFRPPRWMPAARADAILFGSMGWPDVRFPDGTEIIPQLDLRMEFDLYAGVRPIRWFPGLAEGPRPTSVRATSISCSCASRPRGCSTPAAAAR